MKTKGYPPYRRSDKDVTPHKLRKLLGIVKSSEKLSGLLSSKEDQADSDKKSKKKPKAKSTVKQVKPQVVHHKLEGLRKGDDCPKCDKGKVYKFEPARLLRVTGNTAYTSALHLSERLRCNACGEFFTANLPEDILEDGSSDQKYGFSARSIMGINKYFAGAPYFQQESLQGLLGMPITASTIFDQCEYLTNDIYPVFKYFKHITADAIHFHIDDTGNRILDQKSIKNKRRNSDKMQIQTGINSSGMARLDNNIMEQQIKLIVRNRKNASFLKTSVGADVGDMITSMIATVSRSSANLFDYPTVLQRNSESVKENPGKWLPWNYEENKKVSAH